MAASTGLKGRRVLVLGANAAGVQLVRFLVKRGADTTLLDSRPYDVVEAYLKEHLDLSKFQWVASTDAQGQPRSLAPDFFETPEWIVVTPGLPLDTKELELARSKGVRVVSELEFVFEYTELQWVAVAGTKGKSTTAHVLTHLLAANGKAVANNISEPLSAVLNKSKAVDYLVATVNPFQLEGTQNFKPQNVVFLNLSEDHLNVYPNYETYLAANREVLKNVTEDTIVVSNAMDANVQAFVGSLPAKQLKIEAQPGSSDADWAVVSKNQIVCKVGKGNPKSLNLSQYRLRGIHMRENTAAAVLMALALGVSFESIQPSLDQIATLPNRIEFVRRLNSVAFYNDSASTCVASILRTLQAFTEPVILISGGRDRNADYTSLSPHIRQRVKNLILVGEAKEKINRMLGDYTETFLVGTLEEAVILAYQKSRSGDVVLMSPGADGTDLFANNEARGEHFKKLVNQISQPRRPNVI
jgi:UDP-N-acetylmuramoylalanine--D-glutamate ligase